MKINITLGHSLISNAQHNNELRNIYSYNDILIQSDLNGLVYSFIDEEYNGLFIFGNVIKTSGGANNRDYDKLFNKSIESIINNLEGCYLVIKISKGSQCSISCDGYARNDIYYKQETSGVVFSTELTQFLSSVNSYNQIAISHSLYMYGYRPAKNDTLYNGINRIGVGEIAIWKNSNLKINTVNPRILNTEKYNSDKLSIYSDIFLNSVNKGTSENGNIVYLSSGWDSTAILGSLVKLKGKNNVKAIIGRMKYSERAGVINTFELERAKAVADYYGVALEIVEFDYHQRGPDLVEKYSRLMKSQMLSSMTFFNHVLLAEHIANKYNGEAVFCGEISDGVHNLGFSQFVTRFHPVLDFREYSDKMMSYLFGPTFYNSIIDGSYKTDFVFNSLKNGIADHAFDDLNKENPGLQLLSSFFLRDNRFPFWSLKNSRIFTNQGMCEYETRMQNKYLKHASAELHPGNLYSWFIHLYNSFHWQGGTVSTLNHTARENGFEIQLPFWDSELQEYLSKMPENWGRGLDFKRTKYPLKWMLENYIDYPYHLQVGPHSYLYDVEHSFSHAAEFIYASAFTTFFKDLLKQKKYKNIFSEDYINVKYFDKITENYLDGNEASGSERNDLVALIFFSLECN